MNTIDFTFSYKDLNITFEDLLALAPNETQGIDDFREIVDDILLKGLDFIHAKGGYRILEEIELHETTLILERETFTIENILSKQLKKSEKIAVFVCTVGTGIREVYDRHINEGNLLQAFFVDTVGTVAVEKAMDMIHEALSKNLIDINLRCTNRFSPGYCGWSVMEQHKLLKLLPYNYCGINLTPNALMLPIKSVSGIIGIGSMVSKKPYSCSNCKVDRCVFGKNKKR